jgi:hypothetical protein
MWLFAVSSAIVSRAAILLFALPLALGPRTSSSRALRPRDPVAQRRDRPRSGFESARNRSYNALFLSKQSKSLYYLNKRVSPIPGHQDE